MGPNPPPAFRADGFFGGAVGPAQDYASQRAVGTGVVSCGLARPAVTSVVLIDSLEVLAGANPDLAVRRLRDAERQVDLEAHPAASEGRPQEADGMRGLRSKR